MNDQLIEQLEGATRIKAESRADLAPLPFQYLTQIAVEDVIPLGCHIDLTYRCDLSCSHCYLEDRRRREMTVEEYRDFFAELAELGGLYMMISGGDIFVRKDALSILWAASEQRFDMTMITHGMAITDHVADQLAEMGMRCVNVSVYHSDPAIHDKVTRREGSFERTMAGIHRCLDRGIDVLIKTPVFDDNAGAQHVMPQFAASLGARHQMGAEIRGGNDGTDSLLGLNMALDEKANVYDCVLSHVRSLEEIEFMEPEMRTCLAAHSSFYLAPDGVVQPCLDYEQSCGNVRDQSFTEIWQNAPLFQEMRGIRRRDFGGCSSCENFSFCGLCPALAHRETGSPTGSAPSKCAQSTAIRYAFDRKQAVEMAAEFDLFRTFGLGGGVDDDRNVGCMGT